MDDTRNRWRHYLPIVLVPLAYVVAAYLIPNQYYQLIITLVLLWAVLALSWNLISGYSGLTSFGHAAYWGIGAYTVTLLLVHWDVTPWLGIPIGMIIAVIASALIGYPTFRLGGAYFALAMLSYPLVMLYVFEWLGYQEVPLPMKRDNPWLYMQFADQRIYVILSAVLLALSLVVSLWVERSRFGKSLLAIKQNEPAAEAAGIDTLRWKMFAIMLSGAIGAAAGGLYALVLLIVTPPTVFGMLVSAQAAVLALFGGVGTMWGPVIGASILVPLAETLHAELGHIVPGIQGVIYGVAIIATILLAPEGIYWEIKDRMQRRRQVTRAASGMDGVEPVASILHVGSAAIDGNGTPPPLGKPLLELSNVSRSFGGLKAVTDVSLVVEEGVIQGIIGPNGAGKTTLFNVINGFIRPDQGQMSFMGHNLVGLKPNKVCRFGIGRTFQVVRTFPRMTVLENVVVGAYVGTPDDAEAGRLALEALDRVGLADRADTIASRLTNRELRLMELARALAPKPKVVLIDEMFAGLTHQDVEHLLPLLRQLRHDGLTIVIIEHTMHAMVRLADRFMVLDHGRNIAEGSPGDVVRNPKVIEAYLGKRWMERVGNQIA